MRRFILIGLLLIVGCAPWVRVGGLYQEKSCNFSVQLPEGWMRLNTTSQGARAEHLLVTRDGVLLQYIFIKRQKIDESFEHTKKKLKKGMLPEEVSEVILDDISSDQAVLNFRIIENVPAEIGGIPGFRGVFTYENADGLKLKSIYYGFLYDEWFYAIRYNAALRHYFEKDAQTFEKVFRSFKLIKKG